MNPSQLSILLNTTAFLHNYIFTIQKTRVSLLCERKAGILQKRSTIKRKNSHEVKFKTENQNNFNFKVRLPLFLMEPKDADNRLLKKKKYGGGSFKE